MGSVTRPSHHRYNNYPIESVAGIEWSTQPGWRGRGLDREWFARLVRAGRRLEAKPEM